MKTGKAKVMGKGHETSMPSLDSPQIFMSTPYGNTPNPLLWGFNGNSIT